MKPKPTMQDVATAAGVSLMTVSYALRHHPSIPPRTRERVQRAAEEIGYSRNPLVSALMAQIRSTKVVRNEPVIAYLSCFSDRRSMMLNPFRHAYYEGALRRCGELGFRMELVELKEQTPRAGKRLSEVMRYQNVEGVICGPTTASGTPIPIEWANFACCAIGYYIRSAHLHQVNTNYSRIVRVAINRLRELGYSKIGFICTALESERIEGDAVAGIAAYNRKLPPKERVATGVLVPRQWNIGFLTKWLLSHQIDALLFQSRTPYKWLLESDIKIPGDLAVATLEKRIDPDLAGIDQHPELVGAAAVDVVVDQLNQNVRGIVTPRKLVLIDGHWVDGLTAPSKAS